ncbi:MAG: hypothetical protein IJW18_09030 [Lachnospiraceae bacterium]|nr:hypothetical protein [Lachnospiraceae bacterium]
MDLNILKNDPRFANIDTDKFEILKEILAHTEGKSAKEVMPYFLAASKKAEEKGVTFSNQETDLILEILTKDMTPAEKSRIDYMRKLAAMVLKKH